MGDVAKAFEDAGDWIVGAAEDVGDWVVNAADDIEDWVVNATEDVGDWVVDAADDVKEFFEEVGEDLKNSLEFLVTGNLDGDDGNNRLVAIGLAGTVRAYGGDDEIITAGFYVDIYTGTGNDNIYGGAGYLDVTDTSGNLGVYGAAGGLAVDKNGAGNITVGAAAVASVVDHTGLTGDISFGGLAGYNRLTRAGKSGDVSFTGAGAANSINSFVESGNIVFEGAGADNHLVRQGKTGDIRLSGAGASNRIERIRQHSDTYSETSGSVTFEGVGGYNSIFSDVAHGDISFSGAGAYNTITRKGADNDIAVESLEFAKAEEIVLTTANLGGSWILENNQSVTGIKSTTEANTYLFAFADSMYTKISKVRLYNDPVTGKLGYHATSWYKEGNHLTNLADQDISSENGFHSININGAYRLSNLNFEQQQSEIIHDVQADLTEYEWHLYSSGSKADAAKVTLGDAKMGGSSISPDGSKIDVSAVKSNRQANTYVYAKMDGPYTKIVTVELANDEKTGELKYIAHAWYKVGDFTADIANEDISAANGYRSMYKGGYSLSDLHYTVDSLRSTTQTLSHTEEYSDQNLVKAPTDSGESSGDVRFKGAGGGNVIQSNVTRGNVYFDGAGAANVITHSSKFGNTEFNGAGLGNVIVKSGQQGDLTFHGAGLANVLVHQSKQGKMDVWAGGLVNVLVRVGDGEYLAHLLAYGNISVHKGNGDSRVVMFGGYNTHTQIGNGNGTWLAAGGFNVMTQVGSGDIASVLVGGANVLTKIGDGDLISGMLGGANVITHISSDSGSSDTISVALGGLNILTKKGKGNALAVMGGGGNVLTHIGDGSTTGVMIGGANVLTKVGNGDTTGVMLGLGNVLTHVGDGQTLGVMGAVGNVFTKVGDGTAIAAMIGAANIFTHVGEGDSWALMGGLGNVFTKVGNGNALALMVAEVNVFTHIGNGTTVALMLAKGNIATKVGNGMTIAAMVGNANIFTHIGDGETFAAMIGQANILTKVGNDLTAALMVGQANIYTHVGDGTSIGIFAGEANIMTKVGDGTTLAAMFGKANIMTHVGDGLTGVLALGQANIVTKVGDGFMGVVAAAKANVVTHVGDATTAAVLLGEGNILTKVGEGTTVGLLISKIGNIMTHVGDGMTIGVAKGKANIITKVGDGLGVNVAWGEANILTHVGDGDRYNFAKGKANIITKVGDGQEVSVVQGKANIITHVGDGDDYTGAWGEANIITKVGDGRNVVLAKGKANIVTQVGDGDSFNALWSKGNIVTKVGDGMQVTAAKGQANIVTTVGNGLSVTATYGDLNINTKVGDGISVNVAWGKYNINTKVGDGLNVAVMKGKANLNVHVGDGLGINASYAQNNVAIKIGNGDFYSLAVASSNTKSNKLSSLFDNIKQTVLGVGGSQAINYLVQGDDASSSGSRKGRGAIATPEITKLNGFQMDEISEAGSDLGDSLSGGVTDVETPDVAAMQSELNVDEDTQKTENPNLIVNGDFEQGAQGWQSTNGMEADYSAAVYGVDNSGHGAIVNELASTVNTSIYQNIQNLESGEVLSLSFDFVQRTGLSAGHGMQVLWNGSIVFSASGNESSWQQKKLQLTAQAGSNRIEFKGTGESNGLGYVLDNVVAKSEKLVEASAVSDNAQQNKAAANAQNDKEKAEADAQRLQQEKDQQLAAVSGSQKQLEASDQEALKTNGQAESEALAAEQKEITSELTDMTRGLDALDSHNNYQGKSGDSWREQFAGGILDNVQGKLYDAKSNSQQQLNKAAQQNKQNQQDVQSAVAKSESGVAKGEENQANSQQDISDAKAKASSRQQEAAVKQQEAQQAKNEAYADTNRAQQRGEQDSSAAQSKSSQAQADAKGAKQDEDAKPDRDGASGSGLSGKAYEAQAAAENSSHVNTSSEAAADGRFSEGLTDDEQEALEGATQAVNRLQVNAGIRGKNSGSSVTEMFRESNADSIVIPEAPESHEVRRKEIQISGVTLQGLGEVAADAAESRVAVRAEKVANLYRWLDSDSDLATDKYVPVPGFERVDADVSDETKERMVRFVAGYIENSDNDVPQDQAKSLATLFVESTLEYDWDKRVEFLAQLESYGYSFEPPHGEKSIVSFWSGKNFKDYRNVLDAAQTDGKKVVYNIDVTGNSFALELNKQLMRWGGMFLDSDNAEQRQLKSAIDVSTFSNTGFWSSVYATGSSDDVYVIADGGMRLGNYFWNVELPALRQLQREGLVGEIRLLDKPASAYKDQPADAIGHRLTDAGVVVKARFDSLSIDEQERLMAGNPDAYKADTLVDIDVNLSAIDGMLRESIPFYALRSERNLLVQENDQGFEVRAWPGDSKDAKFIAVDDPQDTAKLKVIERFIMANFDSYDQLPNELYLVGELVVSHHDGRTRILAEKVDGAWQYKPKQELMSVAELLDAAHVKGKIRGESYQKVLDALTDYHTVLQDNADYELAAFEKLVNLRKQVEGYVLGHPDSGRTPALNTLLSQVKSRIDESVVLAESAHIVKVQDGFSSLYAQLDNAHVKDSKHLYIDSNGDFVTKGKGNIAESQKFASGELAVDKLKAAVSKEYGQAVADAVFNDLQVNDLAKDGKGVDVAGLKKVHLAIEQQLSPVSGTLFIWKPSDHSTLGHAALQIGQGRVQVAAEDAPDFNQKNYVSWWPLGSKSSNIRHIFDIATENQPDLKIRWRDFSQPASQNDTLEYDMVSEENDNFGMEDGDRRLERFIEKLNVIKGVDAKFKDVSEAFTMAVLTNPHMLESAGIPAHVSQPFVEQWNDVSYDMNDVAKRFAYELQQQALLSSDSALMEQRIGNVVRQFAERALEEIEKFKTQQADQGRVFRINLEGLDVAAMQAEWNKLSSDPDARYQLLTKNCSTTVAKVLKAGGADKLIGRTWLPKFGVWTPTALFNYGQALQEAQFEIAAKKQSRHSIDDLETLSGKNKVPESVVSENNKQKNYQSRDLVLEPIKNQETIELGMPEADQRVLADIADRENVIIAVRPVDEKSKSLIASKMYSSKGLFVKAKSSDWGPMSGFIPVDQSFAKGSARRDLDKFNAYAQQSINTGNAVSADLYLNDVRVNELVSKYHSLTSLELDAESGMYKTTATNGEQSTEFFLKKVTVDGAELWQVNYLKDGELAAFKVIGDPVSKQPMTADYDLLTVMHAYGDLGPKDKVKQPMTWEQWKDSVTYEDLSLKQKALYDSEALFTKKDGASLGIVSDRLKELKDVINTGLGRNNGLEMVHHGADDANPYAVMADNFPATFFVPKSFFTEDGLGEGKGSIQTYFNVNEQGAVVIRNPQEFSNFQQVAINVNYRASLNDKWNAGLDKPMFTKEEKLSHKFLDARDELAKKLNGDASDSVADKQLDELNSNHKLQNHDVESWERVAVTPQNDGGETRFDGQLIIQTENDPAAAKAAVNLAGKHPESSVVVQLDADGKYRVVYGEPSQLSGKLRWQVVGHGRDESENNNTRISGYSATELAAKLAKFNQDFSAAENISSKPEHVSIVGCSLVSTDKQKGFARNFITAMADNEIRTDVSARSSEVAVDATGRKHTRDADQQWANKLSDNKLVLTWDEQDKVSVREEAVRNGIAEGDIDLSRVGQSENDGKLHGAIADNEHVFTAPEKRKKKAAGSSNDSDNKLSYSGNIQVNVGDGEFTAINWGTSNVAIKVGTGGFKSLAFGDNNVMVHIGNGDSKHSFDIAGYQALEGAQMFIGNRNVSFNMGRSNDLIVMMDKSIPTPPLVNPFDGASRISGVLQGIAGAGKGQDWLAAQDSQWTLAGAKKFVKDMSGLDQTSSVDYSTLVDLDSQNERSSRGLKSDTEAALNKQYNKWLSGNKKPDTSKMSRADKFRQKNEELAFNLAVGGRGADIQVTTGNWNFMFGDNIQSILDTNLGSLFGLMTQQFSLSGQAGTTFTYSPTDLPRQLKNKLLGKLAGVGADTTLADIFAVDYTANGHIVSRNGEAVDGVAILTEMLEVIAEFGGEQLKSFTDPSKLLDSLKSSLDMGKDAITSFAESHGLKEKAPEEQQDKSTVSVNGETASQAAPTPAAGSGEQADRAFGFNALNLPNLFATIFSSDKQSEMKSLVVNLKENLTADLLNMKEKTFDFLRNSGHLQGDGDLNVSLGNYNFNWGGDGKDLGAYLGDNNNFWGGRGDDVYYATGTSNIFSGGEGNDMGVLMGRENMMFGGDGDDTAVVAGRINHVFMGDGNDQSFVFGEGGTIETGSGLDYVVASGNYNSVQAGDDQDYVVTIGSNNQADLGAGDDFANVFGNYNKIDGKAGKDVIKLMGYHAVLNAGADDDHLIAASISKFSQFDGGAGDDLLVLGGYSNTFHGGAGIDSFIVSADVIDNQVTDISKDDYIVFNEVNWDDLWLQRSGSDLQIQVNRKTGYSSDQAKFESLGSVTFSDYFADNRAELVISMNAKQESGERDYIALSNDAVDNLVQAMSGFAPSAGDAGFIDPLDSNTKHDIALAWSNVNKGTGHIA